MRTIILNVSLLAASLITVVGCQKSANDLAEIAKDELKVSNMTTSSDGVYLDEISIDYSLSDSKDMIKVESKIIDFKLTSQLSFRSEGETWKELNRVTINLNDIEYKETSHLAVKEAAKTVIQSVNVSEIESAAVLLEQLPKRLFEELNKDQYFQNVTMAVFHHLGAFKTALRALDKNAECQCSAFSSYINDESPFFCAEDKIVDSKKMAALIQQKVEMSVFNEKSFKADKTLKYLGKIDGEIYLSNVDKILTNEFDQFWEKNLTESERNEFLSTVETNDKRFPIDPFCLVLGVDTGGDCGCCGNYSGSCWGCSLLCYAHDHACEDCGWGCGWACVEGPC